MNRYEFENLISDYLEGELSISKSKEFESYLENDENARVLFLKVKGTINDMKNAKKISAPENFNSKLLTKIKDETPLFPNQKSNIFGLSPLHASIFSCLCLAVIFISYSLISPRSGSSSKVDYSLIATDKTQKSASLQARKNNTNALVDDSSDTLNTNSREYKLKKNNKIKFVKY